MSHLDTCLYLAYTESFLVINKSIASLQRHNIKTRHGNLFLGAIEGVSSTRLTLKSKLKGEYPSFKLV